MSSMEGNDGFAYRGPAPVAVTKSQPSITDEAQYSTLIAVRNDIAMALEDLYKDFNAFDVFKDDVTEEAKEKMLRQIAGKQEAYNILFPVLETIDSTMLQINAKYKGN